MEFSYIFSQNGCLLGDILNKKTESDDVSQNQLFFNVSSPEKEASVLTENFSAFSG
jgi:hypothetical protein